MTEPSRAAGLGQVIATQIADWGGAALPLERIAFGTNDPDAIADAVDAWCLEHLGAAIDHYLFFDSSSGSVHGLHLTDGRDVVVKVHRPGLTFAYLAASHRAPAGARRARDARTRAVGRTGPVRRGARDRGRVPPERSEGRRPRPRSTARARIRTGRVRQPRTRARARPGPGFAAPDGDARGSTLPRAALGPVRLRRDGRGCGMDRRARHARPRACSTPRPLDPPVLVHGDWRIENVNVDAGAVVAIYDWDSVCVEPEVFAVANATVTHSVDWSRPEGEHFPSNAAMRSFLADYETARGEPFPAGCHSVIAARMVYHLAYGARCEHAISFPERRGLPAGVPAPARRGPSARRPGGARRLNEGLASE